MCAAQQTPKRILIIDDDLDLLMILERRLAKEGYSIETAASLKEAEELVEFFSPHLVLLDINVNGEDGRKLCWKLKKEEHKDVKVVIMSGYDFDTGRAVLFGADDLLQKPFHAEFLLHRVDTHLQQAAPLNILPFTAAMRHTRD